MLVAGDEAGAVDVPRRVFPLRLRGQPEPVGRPGHAIAVDVAVAPARCVLVDIRMRFVRVVDGCEALHL